MSSQNIIMVYVAAFLAVFGEASLPGLRTTLGAQVDLLPALMVYTAMHAGLANLSVLAVLGGLGFDALSANPLGISILPLFLTGLAIFTQRDLILRDLPFAQFVIGAGASAVVPLGQVLMMLSAGKPLLLDWGSLWQWAVMIAGGAIATPVVFAVFNWFDRVFGYKLHTESSFRPDREIRRGRS
jgi:rod shape-determining protein MreD